MQFLDFIWNIYYILLQNLWKSKGMNLNMLYCKFEVNISKSFIK